MTWLRENLLASPANAALTLGLAFLLWQAAAPLLDWAIFDAVWRPDSRACRAARGEGACWGFIAEKHRFILFGTYPFEQHWRPASAGLILMGLWVVSCLRVFWKKSLVFAWLAGLGLIGALMWGGVLGLPYVENERWGGLVLTLLLATLGLAAAFPLAILLALGRRSRMPLVRALSAGYIELVRGVPLISVLFMASVMLPLFLPEGVSLDKLARALAAMILFAAAYLAEVVRGGLQAVPAHQYRSADALGLGYWPGMRLVILPQALRFSVPPLLNTCIGFFKDTSLVVVIGLFDLLTAVKVSLQEPAWSGFGVEAYLAASLVYFLFCYAFSRYSARLEIKSGA
jgi:general L-amino acid transport system permease protein